ALCKRFSAVWGILTTTSLNYRAGHIAPRRFVPTIQQSSSGRSGGSIVATPGISIRQSSVASIRELARFTLTIGSKENRFAFAICGRRQRLRTGSKRSPMTEEKLGKPTGRWIPREPNELSNLLSCSRTPPIHSGARRTRSVDLAFRRTIHRNSGSDRHDRDRPISRSEKSGSFRLVARVCRYGLTRAPTG